LSCCFSFFFSSRRRHTRWPRDWSSDVCSSDLCPTSWRRTPPAVPAWVAVLRHEVGHDPVPAGAVKVAPVNQGEKGGDCERGLGQIGRASCRERVESWVVAVRIEKKNRKKEEDG